MITVYFKQAVRNLRGNKIYTSINVAGLAIASAFILLVTLYVRHAMKMDTYSDNLRNVYRIELTDLWRNEMNKPKEGFFNQLAGVNEKNQLVTPVSLAIDLEKDFPEVEETVRFGGFWQPVIRVNNQSFKEEGKSVVQVDRNFFKMMDLPVIQGSAASPFTEKHSVVISERAAKKYFGNSNPIGQTLSISELDSTLYSVSAVAKNFPANSSLQYDIMTLVEADPSYEERLSTGNNNMAFVTLIQLKKGTDIALFKQKLERYGKNYFKDQVDNKLRYSDQKKEVVFHLTMRPFSDGHYNLSSPWPYFTDVKSMYQLILLALVALGIAAVNYVLLSLSRVAARSQETGIRKTLGAGWKQVMQLFLTETYLLVIVSIVAGFMLAMFALPFFNELANVKILFAELFQWDLLLILSALSFILTLLAGIYPALQMAGISPLNMMRKFSTYKVNPVLSRVFITLQYSACIVLVIFAIVVARQMNFVFNKDLGFDKDQVMVVENPFVYADAKRSAALKEQLRNYITTQPAFSGITGTAGKFGHSNRNGHMINGKREMIKAYQVDFNFFDFSKIPIVKGRAFSTDFPIDTMHQDFPKEKLDSTGSRTMRNVVVNETLYAMLGTPPLGEINRSLGSIIIGVCKDYAFEALYEKNGPVYHTCYPEYSQYFWLKINKGQNIASVTDKLKTAWSKMSVNEPFSFTFMDEDVKAMYESHSRWVKIISTASWLAIFISCLGLFGLTAVMAVNRTKEIGIRKILGASLLQIFYSLNKGTLLLVLLSIALAIPLAITISNSWLQDFAYRIQLDWVIYAIAACIGLISAMVAVSFHTLKAARANPVKSLRTE